MLILKSELTVDSTNASTYNAFIKWTLGNIHFIFVTSSHWMAGHISYLDEVQYVNRVWSEVKISFYAFEWSDGKSLV